MKRIHHTCKVGKGKSLFNSDLIYDSELQLCRKVCNKPHDLHQSGTLELFLVSLLYEHICLRIDVFQINYCVNILFIIWFLSVFYSITFVLPNTDLTQCIRIGSFTDKQYSNLCSIWDIFILMRCVFLSPVKCYLQVLLGLHRAHGEISNKRLFTNFVCRFYTFHTSHTVFLPLPSKNETVSHLVGVWNISNRDTFSQPRDVAMA